MQEYIVALKRGQRERAPSNWQETVKNLPGVTIEGNSSGSRLQVQVTDNGLESVKKAVGAYCYIEPLILHERHLAGS